MVITCFSKKNVEMNDKVYKIFYSLAKSRTSISPPSNTA